MFWEFFRFELRLRRKSISTYIYFFVWFAFAFLCVASENFGPVAFSNGKVLLNGPYAASFNAIGVSLFGVIIVGDFRYIDPARLSARHVPNPFYQADFKVCLPRRALGRLLCYLHPRFFRLHPWGVAGHFRALGGPFADWPQPFLVGSSAFSLDHCGADFCVGIVVLLRRRTLAQDLRGLRARSGALHPLPDRHHRV